MANSTKPQRGYTAPKTAKPSFSCPPIHDPIRRPSPKIGPSVEWNDRGRVFEVGSQTCVPVDCYEDVLIVDEFNLDEPTFFQVKYYALGVGNVQIGFKGDDPNGETLELVELRMLNVEELAQARDAALALEANAHKRSEVYATTEPIVAPE